MSTALGREYMGYEVAADTEKRLHLANSFVCFLESVASVTGVTEETKELREALADYVATSIGGEYVHPDDQEDFDWFLDILVVQTIMDIAPCRTAFTKTEDGERTIWTFTPWMFDNSPEKEYDKVFLVKMAPYHTNPLRINAENKDDAAAFAVEVSLDEFPGFFLSEEDLKCLTEDPCKVLFQDPNSKKFVANPGYPQVVEEVCH